MALFKSGSKSNERSSLDNAAKTLLANIRFISVDNPVRTIVLTSAVPNEGKTFVTSNLARAIATSGKSVLLVECDMRRRSMAHQLGIHAQHGLYSVLSGEVGLSSASVETDTPNFFFLDAEPHIPNPSDMINSERFSRFIELAASMYDYVVFDTPPVGTFVDAAVLGAKVDAVFLVVRENFAKKAEVAAAAEQLRKAGCNLAGIVMNYCERRDSEYYYEYYYKEGSTDGKESESRNPLSRAASAARKAVPSRPERRSSASASSGSTELPSRPARPARQAAPAPAPEPVPAEEKVSSSTDMDLFAPPSKAIETETRPAAEPTRGEHHLSASSLPTIDEQPRAVAYSSATPAATAPAASAPSAADDRIMDTGIYASLAARAREERAEQEAAQQAAFDEQKTGDLSSAHSAASRSVNPYIVRRSSEDYY